MNTKSWNLQRRTEKNQGKLRVRWTTARLIYEPETSHIQKKKVTTFAVDLHSKLVNRVPCFVWRYTVEQSAINNTLYLPTRLILLTCVWDSLPDEHWVSQLIRKLRQEPWLYTSSQTYGNNTIPCPRERSQHFLLGTQRNTASSTVH